jgi:DNA-binding transcriptional MerR regulator
MFNKKFYQKDIPDKFYYKIGEVAEITKTEPYILRYWESEFSSLNPAKNSSGQRIYKKKDIETILRIKHLLYVEGFTIAGAKKKLLEEESSLSRLPEDEASSPESKLKKVKEELKSILTILEKDDKKFE